MNFVLKFRNLHFLISNIRDYKLLDLAGILHGQVIPRRLTQSTQIAPLTGLKIGRTQILTKCESLYAT